MQAPHEQYRPLLAPTLLPFDKSRPVIPTNFSTNIRPLEKRRAVPAPNIQPPTKRRAVLPATHQVLEKFPSAGPASEQQASTQAMVQAHVPQQPTTRRENKQIMERKRRKRINESLDQIKDFILKETKKDPVEYDKLEKADILEMAVQYLHRLKETGQIYTAGNHPPSPQSGPVISERLAVDQRPPGGVREHQSFIDFNRELESRNRHMQATAPPPHVQSRPRSNPETSNPTTSWPSVLDGNTTEAKAAMATLWRPW